MGMKRIIIGSAGWRMKYGNSHRILSPEEISKLIVYLDSKNINDDSLGIKFGNKIKPKRYFILYPCTGGIKWTEAPAYADDGSMSPAILPNNINSLHNGAARMLWYSSPKGYFEHKSSYKPSPNQYIKLVEFIPVKERRVDSPVEYLWSSCSNRVLGSEGVIDLITSRVMSFDENIN